MAGYIINGGTPLCGELRVPGAKNAALPLLAASLMTEDAVSIENCPNISDVRYMRSILETLGCKTNRIGTTISVFAGSALESRLPEKLVKQIRSSVFLLGPMLTRFGRAECVYPGGCEIGRRPIDIHISALKSLGANVCECDNGVVCSCENGLCGAEIALPYPSVGATENAMMAAALARGVSVIKNAACEPELEDLQTLLNAMGADIHGAGGSTIVINGRKRLHGAVCRCSADRIAAGTYMCAVGCAGGTITLKDIDVAPLKAISNVLSAAGMDIELCGRDIRVTRNGALKPFSDVLTAPYPGFPTDLQAQLCAAACFANGVSRITETVFDDRLKHLEELKKHGADIEKLANTAVIHGGRRLYPASTMAHDLRGGAALIIAALGIEGESFVMGAELIERGYENIEAALTALGADVERI